VPVTTLATFSIQRVEVMDQDGEVDAALMPALSPERMVELYRLMVLTRRLDERMLKLQRQGRLGTFARVTGQEAAHIGAVFALKANDWLVPSFRETGAFLRLGLPIEQMLQYWSGDERGMAIPKGLRLLPIAVPVGTHMLHAAGIAWAMRHDGEASAVLTVFGEGATSEGDFHEALNFAGVFRLPVVFLCQNNQWAISVPFAKQTASSTVAQKALGYGLAGIQVDGNDVFAVYKVVSDALERARNGGGATLIEAHTYRVTDHTTSDDARRYRSDEEVAAWLERDPIARLSRYLRRQGLLNDEAEAAAASDGDGLVAEAVARFEAISPPGPEELFAHVYAEPTPALIEERATLLARLEGGR
jgi:pyruvate dehydrogenase E1 component alpha subunit